MRYLFSILLLLGVSFGYAQTISNVDFTVENNNIVLTYDLSDCTSCDVGLFISLDGGLSFSKNSLSPVSGDIGLGVTSGHKKMVWNPLILYPNGIQGDVMFEVCSMGNVKGNVKKSSTNYRSTESYQRNTGSYKENLHITVKGVTFEMVYVKGGSFLMGATEEQGNNSEMDAKPVHRINLSDYYIGKTEVTQRLWQCVMNNNPSRFNHGGNYPVECITWDEANEFVFRLNSLTGKRFRIPTEAQWEYAARGGVKSKGYRYSGSNFIEDVAWFGKASSGSTHPVASKKPNELGLYDMSGNVWEWCYDWYDETYYSYSSKTDPMGPDYGSSRINRGGSYWGDAARCRNSFRGKDKSNFKGLTLGLRLVLED